MFESISFSTKQSLAPLAPLAPLALQALLLTVFVVRGGGPQSEGRGVAESRVRHVGRRAAAVQLVCLGQLLQHHQSSVSSNTPGAIFCQEFLSKI